MIHTYKHYSVSKGKNQKVENDLERAEGKLLG